MYASLIKARMGKIGVVKRYDDYYTEYTNECIVMIVDQR